MYSERTKSSIFELKLTSIDNFLDKDCSTEFLVFQNNGKNGDILDLKVWKVQTNDKISYPSPTIKADIISPGSSFNFIKTPSFENPQLVTNDFPLDGGFCVVTDVYSNIIDADDQPVTINHDYDNYKAEQDINHLDKYSVRRDEMIAKFPKEFLKKIESLSEKEKRLFKNQYLERRADFLYKKLSAGDNQNSSLWLNQNHNGNNLDSRNTNSNNTQIFSLQELTSRGNGSSNNDFSLNQFNTNNTTVTVLMTRNGDAVQENDTSSSVNYQGLNEILGPDSLNEENPLNFTQNSTEGAQNHTNNPSSNNQNNSNYASNFSNSETIPPSIVYGFPTPTYNSNDVPMVAAWPQLAAIWSEQQNVYINANSFVISQHIETVVTENGIQVVLTRRILGIRPYMDFSDFRERLKLVEVTVKEVLSEAHLRSIFSKFFSKNNSKASNNQKKKEYNNQKNLVKTKLNTSFDEFLGRSSQKLAKKFFKNKLKNKKHIKNNLINEPVQSELNITISESDIQSFINYIKSFEKDKLVNPLPTVIVFTSLTPKSEQRRVSRDGNFAQPSVLRRRGPANFWNQALPSAGQPTRASMFSFPSLSRQPRNAPANRVVLAKANERGTQVPFEELFSFMNLVLVKYTREEIFTSVTQRYFKKGFHKDWIESRSGIKERNEVTNIYYQPIDSRHDHVIYLGDEIACFYIATQSDLVYNRQFEPSDQVDQHQPLELMLESDVQPYYDAAIENGDNIYGDVIKRNILFSIHHKVFQVTSLKDGLADYRLKTIEKNNQLLKKIDKVNAEIIRRESQNNEIDTSLIQEEISLTEVSSVNLQQLDQASLLNLLEVFQKRSNDYNNQVVQINLALQQISIDPDFANHLAQITNYYGDNSEILYTQGRFVEGNIGEIIKELKKHLNVIDLKNLNSQQTLNPSLKEFLEVLENHPNIFNTIRSLYVYNKIDKSYTKLVFSDIDTIHIWGALSEDRQDTDKKGSYRRPYNLSDYTNYEDILLAEAFNDMNGSSIDLNVYFDDEFSHATSGMHEQMHHSALTKFSGKNATLLLSIFEKSIFSSNSFGKQSAFAKKFFPLSGILLSKLQLITFYLKNVGKHSTEIGNYVEDVDYTKQDFAISEMTNALSIFGFSEELLQNLPKEPVNFDLLDRDTQKLLKKEPLTIQKFVELKLKSLYKLKPLTGFFKNDTSQKKFRPSLSNIIRSSVALSMLLEKEMSRLLKDKKVLIAIGTFVLNDQATCDMIKEKYGLGFFGDITGPTTSKLKRGQRSNEEIIGERLVDAFLGELYNVRDYFYRFFVAPIAKNTQLNTCVRTYNKTVKSVIQQAGGRYQFHAISLGAYQDPSSVDLDSLIPKKLDETSEREKLLNLNILDD